MIKAFKVIKLFIFSIVCFVLTKSCVRDYVNGPDKNKISEYNKMINEDSAVYAELSQEYTETTVGRIVKMYTFGYSFVVDNETYEGNINLHKVPELGVIKIFYLKTNPNIVVENPQKEIETEKSKGNSKDLIMGIIWGLLLLYSLFSLTSYFIRDDR